MICAADMDLPHMQFVVGLINVTSPMAAGPNGKAGVPGPPIFFSYPHYCDADPMLSVGVDGLACDKDKHTTFIDVEPTTGRLHC